MFDNQTIESDPVRSQEVGCGDNAHTSLMFSTINLGFSKQQQPLIVLSGNNLGTGVTPTILQNYSTNFNNQLDPKFPDHQMVNSFRETSEEIGEIRQDLEYSIAIGRLEVRLGTLETLISRFLGEQKQIRDRVSKMEINLKSCKITINRSTFRPIVSCKSRKKQYTD